MELQKISDIEQTLYFTEYDFLQLFSKSFPPDFDNAHHLRLHNFLIISSRKLNHQKVIKSGNKAKK